MKYLLAKDQITTSWKDGDFALKTQRQLSKDLQMTGFEVRPSLSNRVLPYEELHSLMKELIFKAIQKSDESLFQLMYQVDLPEDFFVGLLDDSEFADALSDILIRREAYKVFLRSRF